MDDHIALAGQHDALLRDDEAVAFAAAPFAGGVAMAAARDPAVVGQGIGNDQGEAGKDEREPCKASEHGYVPFVVPARQPIKPRLIVSIDCAGGFTRLRARGIPRLSDHWLPTSAPLPASRFMQSRSDRPSRVGHKAPMVF